MFTTQHRALPIITTFLLSGTLFMGGCGSAGAPAVDPTSDNSVSARGPSRNAVPTIRSFTPTTGGVGVQVRVDGAGFDLTSRVFFATLDPTTGAAGFVPAATTFVGPSRLLAVVPEGAVTGALRVVTANSTDATSLVVFTSTAPPPTVPGTGGGGGTTTPPAATLTLADVLAQTGDQMVLGSLPGIVQLRPNRMRIEVNADVAPDPTAVCAGPAVLPSLNAVEALLDPTVASNVGLRGRAMVVIDPLASPAGATPAEQVAAAQAIVAGTTQLSSVVPGLGTIDVTDMPTPPDEPGVAVGNDAAGNVLEIVWLPGGLNGFAQSAPIVRIQLADPSLVTATDTLRIVWTLETYDKTTGLTIQQWWGQAGNIRQ
jgi:hypothetical protein